MIFIALLLALSQSVFLKMRCSNVDAVSCMILFSEMLSPFRGFEFSQ